MTPKDAATRLRPSFVLASMPQQDRRRVKFVEAVMAELDIEPTAFNLHQVASALDAANIHEDADDYPMLLYSRRHHIVPGIEPSIYDPRHDWVWTYVINEEQRNKLGADWMSDPAALPPRGGIPLQAPSPPFR